MYRSSEEYERMCKLAIDIIVDYDIKIYPLDMDNLCKKMGFILTPYSACEDKKDLLLKKSFDGFSNYSDPTKKPIIFFNDIYGNIPPARISQTKGHEIKHIVERDRDDSEDDLCDYFSKYLRCPTPYVIYLGITDVNEIISTFELSYEQATYVKKQVTNRIKRYGYKYFEYELPLLKQLLGNDYDENQFEIIRKGGVQYGAK